MDFLGAAPGARMMAMLACKSLTGNNFRGRFRAPATVSRSNFLQVTREYNRADLNGDIDKEMFIVGIIHAINTIHSQENSPS
jgi:hypothetical protein